MKNIVKKIYCSQIGSTVIATLIASFVGFVIKCLYSIVKPLYKNFSIESFADFMKKTINIDVSLFSLFLIALLCVLSLIWLLKYSLKTFYEAIKKILEKKCKRQSSYPNLINSTVNFSFRIAQSFPATRGIRWVKNPISIRRHLKKFFEEPLTYYSNGGFSSPIWWFRGTSNMPIDSFSVLFFNKYLIGRHEYKIKRIAVYHDGVRDYSDFIYVEVVGEKPTGLYKKSKKLFEEELKNNGYVVEEYGLYKYLKVFKKKLTLTEYDDSATQICGRIVNTSKSELRIRHLTKYNFIICAQESPYNSPKFDKESEPYFNAILRGEIKPDLLFNWLNTFQKENV